MANLNTEESRSLLEQINSHKANSVEKLTGKSENASWIIHIGVISDMTGRLGIFNDLKDISACPVGLANGSHVLATNEGSIELE